MKNVSEKHYKKLSGRQFGFNNSLTITDAICELTKHVLNILDKRDNCLAVFLDLNKTFDMVPYEMISSVVEIFGTRLQCLTFFSDSDSVVSYADDTVVVFPWNTSTIVKISCSWYQ